MISLLRLLVINQSLKSRHIALINNRVNHELSFQKSVATILKLIMRNLHLLFQDKQTKIMTFSKGGKGIYYSHDLLFLVKQNEIILFQLCEITFILISVSNMTFSYSLSRMYSKVSLANAKC